MDDNQKLIKKYALTSYLYDILDAPWERRYRKWRPHLVGTVDGKIVEAGVGTGRNLPYYPDHVQVLGFDLSPGMLRQAERRKQQARCPVALEQADAVNLKHLSANHFDWYISTFMYCVMPDSLQPAAIAEMVRVLRPGGRFRLLEMVYSRDPQIRRRQELWAPFVEKVYGARFDRRTLDYLRDRKEIEIVDTRFLQADTYLLIEGTVRS